MIFLTRKPRPLQWSFTGCELCSLSKTRRFVVMPRTAASVDGETFLLFIGLAPNAVENLVGTPVVGNEFEVMRALLSAAKIRVADVAFTYGTLCHAKGDPADSHLWCLNNLKEIVEKIKPAGIVYLGTEARGRYKKGFTFIESTHITALNILVKSGGIASPLFFENVNRLRALADEIAPF